MSKRSGRSVLAALIGFMLSAVSFVGYYLVVGMANKKAITSGEGTMAMILWAVLCIIALLLCLFAFLRSTLSIKTLALVGIIISGFTLLITIWSAINIYQATSNPELIKLRQTLGNGYDQELNKLKERLDKKEIVIEQKRDSIDQSKD